MVGQAQLKFSTISLSGTQDKQEGGKKSVKARIAASYSPNIVYPWQVFW